MLVVQSDDIQELMQFQSGVVQAGKDYLVQFKKLEIKSLDSQPEPKEKLEGWRR